MNVRRFAAATLDVESYMPSITVVNGESITGERVVSSTRSPAVKRICKAVRGASRWV